MIINNALMITNQKQRMKLDINLILIEKLSPQITKPI